MSISPDNFYGKIYTKNLIFQKNELLALFNLVPIVPT